MRAFLIGFCCGLRTFTPPALIARAVRRGRLPLEPPLAQIGGRRLQPLLAVLAVLELVGDKLPITPNRTELGGLTGRTISGAACGACLAAGRGRPAWRGALLGAAGGVAGTFAGFEARRQATEALQPAGGSPWGAPLLVALVEDAIAVALASWTLLGVKGEREAD